MKCKDCGTTLKKIQFILSEKDFNLKPVSHCEKCGFLRFDKLGVEYSRKEQKWRKK